MKQRMWRVCCLLLIELVSFSNKCGIKNQIRNSLSTAHPDATYDPIFVLLLTLLSIVFLVRTHVTSKFLRSYSGTIKETGAYFCLFHSCYDAWQRTRSFALLKCRHTSKSKHVVCLLAQKFTRLRVTSGQPYPTPCLQRRVLASLSDYNFYVQNVLTRARCMRLALQKHCIERVIFWKKCN